MIKYKSNSLPKSVQRGLVENLLIAVEKNFKMSIFKCKNFKLLLKDQSCKCRGRDDSEVFNPLISEAISVCDFPLIKLTTQKSNHLSVV